MRHWGIATGVALGAALGLSLGMTHWPVDPERLARSIDSSAFTLDVPTFASLRLLPRPTLTLKSVRLTAVGGAVTIRASHAKIALRLDRLLAAAFVPTGLTLSDAEINVDLDSAARALHKLDNPPVTQLIVNGGSLDVASAQRQIGAHIDLASARIDWPSADSGLRAVATGRWRTQPAQATLDIAAPLAALRGGSSAVSAALDAPLAQMRLAGDWTSGGGPDGVVYRGQASALVPSLDRFARWLGRPPLPGPAGLELSTRLSANASRAKLTDAELKLGGQLFEGDLAFLRNPAGYSLSGSLAADALDLTPLLGPPPSLFDAKGEWSKVAALPKSIPGLALDLRVSASRATWGAHGIENAAASVFESGERFGVRLIDASFAHGALSGEFSLDDSLGDCKATLSLALENADLGGLLGDFGEHNFAGQGGAKLRLQAHGRSPAEIVATADGEGALDIAEGGLNNVSFEEALRRGQRRLVDVTRDMNAGSTRLGVAQGRIEISAGEARFVDVETKAPGLSLSLSGAADLVGRAWRAQVSARQSAEDGTPTPDGAHLDFALTGPWSNPLFSPVSPPAD